MSVGTSQKINVGQHRRAGLAVSVNSQIKFTASSEIAILPPSSSSRTGHAIRHERIVNNCSKGVKHLLPFPSTSAGPPGLPLAAYLFSLPASLQTPPMLETSRPSLLWTGKFLTADTIQLRKPVGKHPAPRKAAASVSEQRLCFQALSIPYFPPN